MRRPAGRDRRTGLHAEDAAGHTRRSAVLTCLALTWLKPDVYLGMVILLGAVARKAPSRGVFAAGAVLGSLVFFVTPAFGARALARSLPVPRRSAAWISARAS